MPPNGSARTTTEKLGFTRARRSILLSGGGKAAASPPTHHNIAKWEWRCRRHTSRRDQSPPPPSPGNGCSGYAIQPAGTEAPAVGREPQLRAFPQTYWSELEGRQRALFAELSKTNPMFKRMLDSLVSYAGRLISAEGAEGGFEQLHDPHAYADLSRRRLANAKPGEYSPGLLHDRFSEANAGRAIKTILAGTRSSGRQPAAYEAGPVRIAARSHGRIDLGRLSEQEGHGCGHQRDDRTEHDLQHHHADGRR